MKKFQAVKLEIWPKRDDRYTARIMAEVDGRWIATGILCFAPSPLIAGSDAIKAAKRKGWWK